MNQSRRSVALIAALLAMVMATGCRTIDRLRARDQLNKGVKAYESKKYDEAAGHFKQSIEYDPNFTDAYLYLATAYRAKFIPGAHIPENIKAGETAIQSFQDVLKRDPDNSNAMASIASIYSGLDRHEDAKDWYRKRTEVDPTNPEPWYGIGTINWQLSYDKTGRTGENVEHLSPEERQHTSTLVDEGIESIKKALELRPDYFEAIEYLNLLYREKAKLSLEEEERRQWEREADKLALQALDLKRKKEAEAEKARKQMFGQRNEAE